MTAPVVPSAFSRAAAVALLAVCAQVVAQPAGNAPRGEDWAGVWMLARPAAVLAADPPLTAWGRARLAEHRPTLGPRAALDANDPTLDCLPPGVPYVWMIPTPFELLAHEDGFVLVFEYDHSVRRIHTDGRGHPHDLQATGVHQWMGHSVGRWEGDQLLIETIGFNDRTWLDRAGYPHSEELRLIERLFLEDRDTLVNQITVDDPMAYTSPWTAELRFERRPDWGILEHVCFSGERVDRSYAEYVERAWRPEP
jgi:hypothetical protein